MQLIYTEPVINRLTQLYYEVSNADSLHYYDRLRELKRFCDETPAIASIIEALPESPIPCDFTIDWRDMDGKWPEGEQGYAYRWDGIKNIVAGGPSTLELAFLQTSASRYVDGLIKITDLYVTPICNFLLNQLQASSTMLYLLLRYKRWAEWFESERLRDLYVANGERGLDRDLRRFLFESGVDYPFSQPSSPGGQVDVVAELDTDDPLVLEIKVWDSEKDYKRNRIRDGLRQAMDYTGKYGKDVGYLVVFNIDEQPLVLKGQTNIGEWPSRLEHGSRTYFFIDVHIAHYSEPVSQRDKGKPVKANEIHLLELLESIE